MSAISITSPVPYTVNQRNGSNLGAFVIAGLYTFASACHVEASTDNFATATRIATLGAGTAAAYSGTLSGVAAGPRVALKVRIEEDHATTASVANVAIGERVLIPGDSRVSPLYANADSYTQTSIGCSQLANDGVTWYDSNDAVNAKRNTWVIRYCDLLAQQLGMAVGCSIQNAGGTDIGDADRWSTLGNPPGDLWPTVLTRIGSGAWGHVLPEFGPNAFAYHVSQSAYRDLCTEQVNFITANVPGAPTKVFWELCGQGANESTGSWKTNVRGGILDHVALGIGGYVGAVIIEQGYESGTDGENDGIHPKSDAHRAAIANRFYLAVQGIVAGTGSAVRGPRPISILRSGATVDVQFDQTLGNAVSSSLTASAWSATDGGSPLTVSAASVLNATTVRLTLASTPAGALLISFAKGDTAVLATIPMSANKTLADSTTTQIPAEPIIDLAPFNSPSVSPSASSSASASQSPSASVSPSPSSSASASLSPSASPSASPSRSPSASASASQSPSSSPSPSQSPSSSASPSPSIGNSSSPSASASRSQSPSASPSASRSPSSSASRSPSPSIAGPLATPDVTVIC